MGEFWGQKSCAFVQSHAQQSEVHAVKLRRTQTNLYFRAVSCILVKGTLSPLNKNPEFALFISTFGIFFCLFNAIGGRMRALAHCFRFFAPFLLHILLMISLYFLLCYMSISHCRTNLRVSEYGLDRFNRHAFINGSSSHRMPETMRNNVLHPALF